MASASQRTKWSGEFKQWAASAAFTLICSGLASATWAQQDLSRARTEFTTVLEQDPPPAARQTIARYLQAIDERDKARKTAFVEGTLGKDSNVNNERSGWKLSFLFKN